MDMASDFEVGGAKVGETVDGPPAQLESKTVTWARELAALKFRNIVLQPGERDQPIGEQVEKIADDLIRRFKPRDPIEEMLIAQMIWIHARVANLTSHATSQHNLKWYALMGEQAERAANLFRRQMLALAEYRRPRGRSFTAIRQANIAGQQVVNSRGDSNAVREEKRGEISVEQEGTGGAAERGLPG
jgi:hypothetical protein